MKIYEAPEVVELGPVSELTLGTSGSCSDNCNCSLGSGDVDSF
jgi:hypothetical protein